MRRRRRRRGGLTAQQFHFGEFKLDPGSYRLERDGRVLRLEKLPMELLLLLVRRQGELVCREEIAERLWGKNVFLDIDHGINTAIRKLRRVLRTEKALNPGIEFFQQALARDPKYAAPYSGLADA